MFKIRKGNINYIDKKDDIHPGALWINTKRISNMGISKWITKYCRIVTVNRDLVSILLFNDKFGEKKPQIMKIERLREILEDKDYTFKNPKEDKLYRGIGRLKRKRY